MLAVAFLRVRFGLGDQEQIAVFGHEQEKQSVHEAQKLTVVVLLVQDARAEFLAQRGI
jgi:hypothetical protein